MIKLKDILWEITLGSVEPYATHFEWRDKWGDRDSFECKFTADSQPILMNIHHFSRSAFADSGTWEFAFFAQSQDAEGWTVRGDRGTAQGQISYLRLIKTIGLALRDFIDTVPGVDVIDITGSDEGMGEKGPQKTAIYRQLLQSNPMMSEFDLKEWNGKLFMIRRNISQADATGIKDADFNAADQRAQTASWGGVSEQTDLTGDQSAMFKMVNNPSWPAVAATPRLYVDMGGVLFTAYRGDTGQKGDGVTYIGAALWAGIRAYDPIILSATSSTKARGEKTDQIKNNLRPTPTYIFVNTGAEKARYARGGNILIDDSQSNITAWEAAGGIGVLHVNDANTIKQIENLYKQG